MRAVRRLVLAFPGDLDTRTGGYIYDRRLALELEARGWVVDRLSLPASFPFPSRADLAESGARFAALASGTTVLVDGLALGAMPEIAAQAARRLDLIGLVHHPLCLETGLSEGEAACLAASERAALAEARMVVVTSPRTARTLVELMGVAALRIAVAVPGTDPAPLAPGSGDGVLRMLSVGSVTPRKGHELLIRALAAVDGRWELAIGGSLDRDPGCTDRLRDAITSAGIDDRVRLLGELTATGLDAAYGGADLFVSASLYEGYGMALGEALARGLPIVAAAGGAVAETVPPEAALFVPPADVPSLRAALRRCLHETGLHHRLRQGAVAARSRLPAWADTAARLESVLTGQPA